MKYDVETISEMIQTAVHLKFNGNYAALARASGVSKQLLFKYLNKRVKNIHVSTWEKLQPYVDPGYVPAQRKDKCELCEGLNEIDAGMVRMYKKLDVPKKKIVRNQVEDLSGERPLKKLRQPEKPGFIIEDRPDYLYLEYTGDFVFKEYEKYFYSFVAHPSFGKKPIIQKTNFNDDPKKILGEVGFLYQEHIKEYPRKWALVAPFEVYHKAYTQWKGTASGVASMIKMVLSLAAAEAWIKGEVLPVVEAHERIERLTQSATLRVIDFIDNKLERISGGGGG